MYNFSELNGFTIKYPYKPFPVITECYSDGLDNQLKSYNR